MTSERPTVLLTRTEEENESLAPVFAEKGLSTISVPGIVIEDPPDWSDADAAIATLAEFDGILFTSKNAVRKFLERIETVRPDARHDLASILIAAVGGRTEESLKEAGVRVDTVPEVGSAENLLESLDAMDVRGKRFLFPKSSIARDVLPAELRNRGALVEDVVVYRTVPPNAGSLDEVRDSLSTGKIAGVAFFSPSAVRNIVQLLGARCLERPLIAVIGPTTEHAARAMHVRVDLTATTANAATLAEEMVLALRARHGDPAADS